MVGRTSVLLSSYTCKWSLGFRKFQPDVPKPLSWFVDIAATHGLDGVQFADNVTPERLSDADVEAIASYAGRKGIKLQWGFDGWEDELVRRMIAICRLSGASQLRGVFGPAFGGSGPREARITAAVRAVQKVLPELEQYGIVLSLENHFDLKVRELLEVVNSVGTPLVRICLDTTNAIGELLRPAEVIELLGPCSVSMHLKDFRIEKIVGGYTILGVAVGEGNQDCKGVLAAARAVNPDIEVCIELGAPWPDPPEKMFEIEARDTRVSIENTLMYLRTQHDILRGSEV